jgi:glutamate dehydrogenase/leucine dehydrogenase
VINAGGIINIASELRGDYDPAWALARVERIRERLLSIFSESQARGLAPHRIAEARARRKLRKAQAA